MTLPARPLFSAEPAKIGRRPRAQGLVALQPPEWRPVALVASPRRHGVQGRVRARNRWVRSRLPSARRRSVHLARRRASKSSRRALRLGDDRRPVRRVYGAERVRAQRWLGETRIGSSHDGYRRQWVSRSDALGARGVGHQTVGDDARATLDVRDEDVRVGGAALGVGRSSRVVL